MKTFSEFTRDNLNIVPDKVPEEFRWLSVEKFYAMAFAYMDYLRQEVSKKEIQCKCVCKGDV